MAKVKKLLVPIDGSERSMHSLDFIKEIYDGSQVEVTIINVKELMFVDGISMSDEIRNSEQLGKELLTKAREHLDGYEVKLYFTFGYAGEEIVKKAEDDETDIIVMTKSSKKGLSRMIGSCTTYVLKHTHSTVMIIPE